MSSIRINKVGWKYHQVDESMLAHVVELCQRHGFNNFEIKPELFNEANTSEQTYELEAWRNE